VGALMIGEESFLQDAGGQGKAFDSSGIVQ